MATIKDILPAFPSIKIVDVGAMNVGAEAYARLMAATSCEIVGFEPNQLECEKLKAQRRPGALYLPHFIGDGTRRTFYQCAFAATSSLFEPNTALLDRFQNLSNLVSVVGSAEVQTMRLDDIPEATGCDYLKVDVQGAELLVFQGAQQLLGNALVVETEVEFVELYKGQPLFAEIDQHLRSRGFRFHRFAHTMGRTLKPFVFNNDVNATLSQTLWGDAIYVRDFMAFEALAPDRLLKLATILHVNYVSVDLAGAALAAYDAKLGTELLARYVSAVTQRSSQP